MQINFRIPFWLWIVLMAAIIGTMGFIYWQERTEHTPRPPLTFTPSGL